MNAPTPYFVVDAFTDRPFAGNPAAVCPLSAWRDDEWLSAVAREMNLSETAFVVPSAAGLELRWFTPAVEVDLCGHATLAAAHALWNERGHSDPELRFQTRSGVLKATRRDDLIELDFPLTPEKLADPPTGLLAALGATARHVGKSRFDYLVELGSDAEVRNLRPDFGRLAAVDCRGVIVTARSADPAFDFVSRFFAPATGIAEDPVTGSAHCCLADFWRKRLGKDRFTAYQASSRGGIVHVRVEGDRAILGGHAITIARGELLAG